MAVKLWRHQCTATGKEEVNFEGQDCPHCGEKAPVPAPAPSTDNPPEKTNG